MMSPGTFSVILHLIVTLCAIMIFVDADRKRLSNQKGGYVTNAHFGRRKTTTTATVTTTTERRTTEIPAYNITTTERQNITSSTNSYSTGRFNVRNTPPSPDVGVQQRNTSSLIETVQTENISLNNSLENTWNLTSNTNTTHVKTDSHENTTAPENSTDVQNTSRVPVQVFDKKKFVESFKRHILMKLGLSEKDISDTIDPLPALPPEHDWLDMISDQPKSHHMNTIAAVPKKVTLMATDISKECAGMVNVGCVEFTKLKDMDHRRVRSAMLWVHFNTSVSNISVTISTLKKKNGELSEMKQLSSKKLKEVNKNWLGFDVKDAVNAWLGRTKGFQGFAINCIDCSKAMSKSLRFVDGYKPVMIFQPKTKRNKIKDRHTDCADGQSTCCMKYFEVDSADVLNIIRFPPRISLNYCTGSCNGLKSCIFVFSIECESTEDADRLPIVAGRLQTVAPNISQYKPHSNDTELPLARTEQIKLFFPAQDRAVLCTDCIFRPECVHSEWRERFHRVRHPESIRQSLWVYLRCSGSVANWESEN